MKTYANVLIVCGSVASAVMILFCLCNNRSKKKRPAVVNTVNTPRPFPPRPAYRDVEKSEKPKSSGAKDGGMFVLGAGAAVAATVATAAVISSAGGCGGTGGGDSGGDGGGGCGGCGGCGG